ncbi:MAG: VOC family protein [Chloroflexota bacterium]
MNKTFKPEGYPSISPYLIVNDADKTIQFLIATFGATEIRRFSNEDGSINHAEVRLDDGVLMLADKGPGWPDRPANVHIYVEDVDAVYQRALANGGESVQEPVQKDDPDKRGGVRDAGGTIWWIATKVS